MKKINNGKLPNYSKILTKLLIKIILDSLVFVFKVKVIKIILDSYNFFID